MGGGELDGGDDVVGGLGQDDADGLDLVVGGVGGVEHPGRSVEADLPGEAGGEFDLEDVGGFGGSLEIAQVLGGACDLLFGGRDQREGVGLRYLRSVRTGCGHAMGLPGFSRDGKT